MIKIILAIVVTIAAMILSLAIPALVVKTADLLGLRGS